MDVTRAEIIDVVTRYVNLQYLDINCEVRFGCDCGCGGDYYEEHPEDWDEMVEEDNNTRKEFENLMNKLGVTD